MAENNNTLDESILLMYSISSKIEQFLWLFQFSIFSLIITWAFFRFRSNFTCLIKMILFGFLLLIISGCVTNYIFIFW